MKYKRNKKILNRIYQNAVKAFEKNEDLINEQLLDLSHDEVRFFLWLRAVRYLPFLGFGGDFNYWNETGSGDSKQKHLLTVLRGA